MCNIPIDILDAENAARAVRVPYHVDEKKNKLRPAAFRPPPERDDLSVMRIEHMGADACKVKAKEIAGDAYKGFAAITAGEVRRTGAEIVDSREGQFCGHAHISQGTPAPKKGETAPPSLLAKYKALSDIARLYVDPDPGAEGWTGSPIV